MPCCTALGPDTTSSSGSVSITMAIAYTTATNVSSGKHVSSFQACISHVIPNFSSCSGACTMRKMQSPNAMHGLRAKSFCAGVVWWHNMLE